MWLSSRHQVGVPELSVSARNLITCPGVKSLAEGGAVVGGCLLDC